MFTALLMLATVNSEVAFRPPAVPLITHTPYFSIWSFADRPSSDWPRHWTGAIHGMCGMVSIDGVAYRWLGGGPATVPELKFVGLEITPTKTVYLATQDGIEFKFSFLSPLVATDIDLLSRPVTYLTIEARRSKTSPSNRHVQLYFDASAEPSINTPDQKVVGARMETPGFNTLTFRAAEQKVLGRSGDDLRIEWGTFAISASSLATDNAGITNDEASRSQFIEDGTFSDSHEKFPRPANENWPVMAFSFDLGTVSEKVASRTLMIAYDEEHSIEFLQKPLVPYWRRNGLDLGRILSVAWAEREKVARTCADLDKKIMGALEKTGGKNYALVGALAYRQSIAAHAVVDDGGTPLMFSKENFSNGCIATVDVIYPACPLYLYTNPELLKAQLEPVLRYASMQRWKWPFAPHDLGQYPLANGQVYGGGERTEENQMPVEESGNMLLMMAAYCDASNSRSLAEKYWPQLKKWTEYLVEKGLDPENQLCTDDFAGHLAHNANLSIKAICAIGGYAKMCRRMNKIDEGKRYERIAKEMVKKWMELAQDGDHTKLAFDKPGTWSQKYNLMWDKVLSLNLFPKTLAASEIASYRTKMNAYGLPLDSRKDYTKGDWIAWTSTLADKREDRLMLLDSLYKFLNESQSRVPFCDWHDTKTAKQVGFQARSVVGGIFAPMLRK